MIKGCSKRVIVIKHPQGDAFEEAYFIVKEGKYKNPRDTHSLITAANKIINGEKNDSANQKNERFRSRVGNVLAFLSGALLSFVIFLLLINI